MKKFKMITLILTFLLALAGLTAQAADNPAYNTIAVQGNSYQELEADQALVTISVVSSARTVQGAQAENAQIMNQVQQQLRLQGITSEQMNTSGYYLSPLYSDKAADNKPAAIIGYSLSHSLNVRINDLAQTGTIIDTALAAGANQISGVTFTKKDEAQAKNFALQAAVKDATSKAEALAAALGKQLVTPISVTENNVSYSMPDYSRMLSKVGAPETSIIPGKIEVTASVNIIFQMQ